MKYAIGRAVDGISLNGMEFVLDAPEAEGGKVMWFESEADAWEFLEDNGVDPDDESIHLVREDEYSPKEND